MDWCQDKVCLFHRSISATICHYLSSVQHVNGQCFCKQVLSRDLMRLFLSGLLMVPAGFGGRGVLPGVATGTNLNAKSSKI